MLFTLLLLYMTISTTERTIQAAQIVIKNIQNIQLDKCTNILRALTFLWFFFGESTILNLVTQNRQKQFDTHLCLELFECFLEVSKRLLPFSLPSSPLYS